MRRNLYRNRTSLFLPTTSYPTFSKKITRHTKRQGHSLRDRASIRTRDMRGMLELSDQEFKNDFD